MMFCRTGPLCAGQPLRGGCTGQGREIFADYASHPVIACRGGARPAGLIFKSSGDRLESLRDPAAIMWIKICANTNLEDALLAAQLGADAVGFVFAPSSRQVTPAEVARITPQLPGSVERVGVFASRSAEEIAHTARVAHLDAVQLHGGMDLEGLGRLRTALPQSVRIIQTVHWRIETADGGETAGSSALEAGGQLRALAASGLTDRVLVDSKIGAAIGGTGVAFDWAAARAVLLEAGERLDLIVAGGLDAGNVAQAIAELEPWGVDVASGVESSPGRKSAERLAGFIRAARA